MGFNSGFKGLRWGRDSLRVNTGVFRFLVTDILEEY